MVDLPTKEKLLDAIQPGLQVTEAFLLQIYGYSVSDPYFAATALDYLSFAGISNAQELYRAAVYRWKAAHEDELNRAAAWFKNKVEDEEKKEEERCKRKLEDMSKAELLAALRKLMSY